MLFREAWPQRLPISLLLGGKGLISYPSHLAHSPRATFTMKTSMTILLLGDLLWAWPGAKPDLCLILLVPSAAWEQIN